MPSNEITLALSKDMISKMKNAYLLDETFSKDLYGPCCPGGRFVICGPVSQVMSMNWRFMRMSVVLLQAGVMLMSLT